MDEHELKSMIGQQIGHSRSYLSAEIASDRQENLRYYLNRPLGNEVEGRSQVISTDVQDTVEVAHIKKPITKPMISAELRQIGRAHV